MKRFKEYERQFKDAFRTSQEIAALDQAASIAIEGWAHNVRQWSNDEVIHAVYSAPDFEQWQRFRISLKGLTTRAKLLCLAQRVISKVIPEPDNIVVELEWCRIDNYINSLKRGGQLDIDYKVVR